MIEVKPLNQLDTGALFDKAIDFNNQIMDETNGKVRNLAFDLEPILCRMDKTETFEGLNKANVIAHKMLNRANGRDKGLAIELSRIIRLLMTRAKDVKPLIEEEEGHGCAHVIYND